ncbi:MAG: hypothetical protein ACTHJX_12880, partial [Terriglobales bacterium]
MEAAGPTAILNDRGAERVRGGHPWIYTGEILGWEPEPPTPQVLTAAVRDRRGGALGWADH